MRTEKRQFNMYEHKSEDWLLPGTAPLVSEANRRGATHSSDFPDGTGQHEEVQLRFRGSRGREALEEPVSHEVVVVLSVITIKSSIIKIILHLCFETTASCYYTFLLLLSFVLLFLFLFLTK